MGAYRQIFHTINVVNNLKFYSIEILVKFEYIQVMKLNSRTLIDCECFHCFVNSGPVKRLRRIQIETCHSLQEEKLKLHL